jgi:WD40 repeat protein
MGNGAVDRLDLSAGTVTRVFGPKSVTKVPTDWDHGIYSLAIVPGGEELVIGMRMGVLVWDLKTSTEKRSIIDPKRGSSCLAVSPDKKQLASAGSGMTVSDFGSGKIIHERRLDNRGGSVCGLAFSPDGKFLVDGVSLGRKSPGYIVVWRTNDYSTESVFPCHTSAFRTMAFMPGTHKIVTGAEDGTVCVWDLDKLRWAESPKRAVTEEKSGSTQGGESGKGHKSN